MTTIPCPLCRQPVTHEDLPVELDETGVPWAVSMEKGYGVPVSRSMILEVYVDGEAVRGCVAFDRRAGIVWMQMRDAAGELVVRGANIAIERRAGVVTAVAKGRRP